MQAIKEGPKAISTNYADFKDEAPAAPHPNHDEMMQCGLRQNYFLPDSARESITSVLA
jgi:hypothetical protein